MSIPAMTTSATGQEAEDFRGAGWETIVEGVWVIPVFPKRMRYEGHCTKSMLREIRMRKHE